MSQNDLADDFNWSTRPGEAYVAAQVRTVSLSSTAPVIILSMRWLWHKDSRGTDTGRFSFLMGGLPLVVSTQTVKILAHIGLLRGKTCG